MTARQYLLLLRRPAAFEPVRSGSEQGAALAVAPTGAEASRIADAALAHICLEIVPQGPAGQALPA